MPDRETLTRAALAIVAVATLSLLFIASYAVALHDPVPHAVPVAVAEGVPASVGAKLDASSGLHVHAVPSAAAALRRIERRESYGAVVRGRTGLVLITAPAASPVIAQFLTDDVAKQLRAGGAAVSVRAVHRLPRADSRGLVGFYTAIGWAIAGYLGATLLGLSFGTGPGARRTLWRLVALAALGVIVGLGGAAIATGIGGYDRGFAKLALVGLLTVLATGSFTVAMQSLLGILGTGVVILLFVVFGNPSAGGASATELLPGLWRVGGPLIPTGAATSAIRNVAYFPAAGIGSQVLVLLVWIAGSVAAAIALGRRGRGLTAAETEASAAGVA